MTITAVRSSGVGSGTIPVDPPTDRPAAVDAAAGRRHRAPFDPRLLRRASAVRIHLLGAAGLGTLTAGSVVLIAWAIASGVGGAFSTRTLDPILAATPLLAAGFAGRAVLTWCAEAVAVRTSAAVKSQLRREVATAYLRPGSQQPDRGTVISLVTTGLDDLDGYFARYLPQLVLTPVVPAVIGIAIATKDLLSAVIIGCTLPLIPIFMILVGWTTERMTGRRWQVQARLAHHFVDLITGLPTLRAFGRARAQTEGLRASGEANRTETMATLRIALLSALVLELLATLSVALVAVVIGLRVIAGGVDLTTALFVLILAPEAYLPLRKLGLHYHDAAGGVAAVRTAFDLIDRAQVRHRYAGTAPAAGAPEVRLEGVTLELGGRRLPARGDLDLIVPAGKLTVLTGPSGGGKSSLLNLIMGWLQPVTGRVLVGGTALSAMDPRRLRRTIAWVGQEPAMLSGTVGDNVRLGLPDATDAEVAQALRAAGADLDPDRLLAEGLTLSAGELRRVALARAWLRVRCGRARLMILDEPTAGLDEDTELAAIRTVTGLGATVIMVSHRPAVLAAADHVVRIGDR